MQRRSKSTKGYSYGSKLAGYLALKRIRQDRFIKQLKISRAYFYNKLLKGTGIPCVWIVKKIEEICDIHFTSKDFEK